MGWAMDERELTRRFFGEPADDPAAKARARDLLEGRIGGGRRRTPLAVAAALVVAILGTSLIWSATRPDTAAAKALGDLAAIQPNGLEPGAGEYLYRMSSELRTETSTVLGAGTYRIQVVLSIEQWIAADGSGERRSVVEGVGFATEADEEAWSEPGAPTLPRVGDVRADTFGLGEGPYVAAAEIPLGADPLLSALRSGRIMANGGSEADVFRAIGDLLAQGRLPRATRAALLEAASQLEGIQLIGPVSDATGRPGEGFSVRTDNLETRLIFDPETGQLLARESLMPDADGAWRLVDREAFTSVEIVSEIG